MKLQDQVITIEQAKRLKELGIIQYRSLFFFDQGYQFKDAPILRYNNHPEGPDSLHATSCISDFTVAELGAMLPTSPKPEGGINYSYYHRNNWRGHSIGYSAPADPKNDIERPWFQNEAEARADLLIYLLEKAIITPEEANTRLLK